jgi:CRP-like cAMP-binding protein
MVAPAALPGESVAQDGKDIEMSVQEISDVLKTSSLGVELDEPGRQELAGVMQIRQYSDGETVVAEGSCENSLDLLLSGELGVVNETAGKTLYILKPGEFAGAMDFLDGQPRMSTLRAINGARIATLRRTDFEKLLDTSPHLVYHVMRDMVRTIHQILLNMNSQCSELTNYVFRQHGRY